MEPTVLSGQRAEQGREATREEAEDGRLGATLGSFRLVRRLASGGMGTVYLGEHVAIGSKVAVKVLHEHLAASEAQVARFYAEARIVNLIGHENIVNIFDMNVLEPRCYYLVMEYLEGRALAELLGRPLAPARAVAILTQVCAALEAAHARGVVHRDLKPDNIFLVARGGNPDFVKVLDFGVAKLYEPGEQPGQTQVGTMVGTPAYMAPEQCLGEAVDGRADLYSLGLIAYQLLTGTLPLRANGLAALLRAQVEVVPTPPHEVVAEVPLALSLVVMRALAKRREERFENAAAMRRALQQALAGHAASACAVGQGGDLKAVTRLEGGTLLGELRCLEISHGGAFLCTEKELPPLLSRVRLTLLARGRTLACSAEVVRHVTPEQARAWGMCPGFAVQFSALRPEQREALACLEREGALPEEHVLDDIQAAQLLEPFRRCRGESHYEALSLAPEAGLDEVRQHVRAARGVLELVASRPLSARQGQELEAARRQVELAALVLGHCEKRAEYDAQRGNFTGVARCLASGLTATRLEALRVRYLAEHPSAEAAALIHRATAASWLQQGDTAQALSEYQKGLVADPLNLALQQAYWKLRRRGD